MLEASEQLYAAAERRAAAGDMGGAAVLLDELLRGDPRHVPARKLLAQAWMASNPTAAANVVHPVVQADPDDLEALTQLAMALSAMGRDDEAAVAFARLAARRPDDCAAHANLTLALTRAGRPHEAVAAGEKAVALDPRHTEARANLGHALNALRDSARAAEAFTAALTLNPGSADALVGLSRAYRDQGMMTASLTAIRRAVDLDPTGHGKLSEMATLLSEMGESDAAREAQRRAAELAPPTASAAGNNLVAMQYDPQVDEQTAAAAAIDWGMSQLAARPPAPAPTPDRSPDRVLRVGYVSADLYRHPVGWLGAGPICAHDRSAVHVTLYANQTLSDPVTERLKASADAWVPVLGFDDDSLAARIAADRIDVLVDLSGHTSGNRLGVFARRAAPVQVTWLGYFATTGLPTVDYVLLDDHHLLPGAEALFSETVVRLPGCRFCYSPPPAAETVRRAVGAKGRPVTFGSFNNVAKLNEAVIALWSRVLAAGPPDSRLLMKWRSLGDGEVQAALRARFARHGVDPGRLDFEGASQHPEMLGRYGDVDVALDPFPFTGGLTTCEALWMGVPVVTLPGPRPVSRQSHAILNALGHPEWSARDAEDYVAIAAGLARDAKLRARLRKSLPAELAASPLCDAERFARGLEGAYRQMWRDYLQGR